jgi:hypothetical protein
MPAPLRRLLPLVATALALGAAAPAHAILGATLAEIIKHRGKKPDGQPDKERAIWTFEGNDGLLVYAVKFGADGRSIYEQLKPGQLGRSLHREIVQDFIKAQAGHLKDSPTLLEPKPGEKYRFAGKDLVVADNEYVLVDAERGVLVVWVRGSLPSVTAITPAALP